MVFNIFEKLGQKSSGVGIGLAVIWRIVELKARNHTRPGITVLFRSGYTGNVITRHGILPESIKFIRKPSTILRLGSKVRTVLDDDLGVIK